MKWQVEQGDVLEVLSSMPNESVHCCVTSPPYWGLRDYQVDGMIGLEPTLDEYIAKMVAACREIKRVLRKDGTFWLNMGDCYAGGHNSGGATPRCDGPDYRTEGLPTLYTGLKPKDLVGQPWRLAFALQADGWWLRKDIIWHKPNPMPESCTDRPTSSHEHVFLLAKSAKYYYDQDAVREGGQYDSGGVGGYREGNIDNSHHPERYGGKSWHNHEHDQTKGNVKSGPGTTHPSGRNLRDVWTIPTQPFPEAHFATFPQALVRPCIKAGTSEKGCCPECGAPWERVVEKHLVPTRKAAKTFVVDSRDQSADDGDQGSNRQKDGHRPGWMRADITIGWRPTCDCGKDPVPCTVLDPFSGAGTTGVVAIRHGRDYIGIELNSEYAKMSRKRLSRTAQGLTKREQDAGQKPLFD